MADGLTEIGEAAGNATTLLTTLTTKVGELYKFLKNTFGQDTIKSVDQFNNAIGSSVDAFDELKKASSDIHRIRDNMDSATDATGKLQNPLSIAIKSFADLSKFFISTTMFDNFAASGVSSINTISDKLGTLQKVFEKLHMTPISNAIIKDIANSEQNEKAEEGFIQMAASSGTLNDLFKKTGGELKDLTPIMAEYGVKLYGAADATGKSVPFTLAYSKELEKIHGILDQAGSSFDKAGNQSTALIESMRLMSGAGISQKQAIDEQTIAYNNLSQAQGKVTENAKYGSELLADTSEAADALGTGFNDVAEILNGVSGQFARIGNETDSATSYLVKYTDALTETGLTTKEAMKITGELFDGISKTTVAQKAFLSARSGGPGGLQGAFQIEELLRQGKVGQVAGMAERSLKQQFGGRIYTQEEAAASPQAAGQFMMQREMLKSGAFGLNAKDDATATKMLEALKKGDTGLVEKIHTGQAAVADIAKHGEQIQDRSLNAIKRVANAVDAAKIFGAISAGANIRMAIGIDSLAKTGLLESAQAGSKSASSASSKMKGMAIDPNLGMYKESSMSNFATQFGTEMLDAGKNIVSDTGEIIKNTVGSAKSSIENLADMHKRLSGEATIEQGKKNMAAHALSTMPAHMPAMNAQHIAAMKAMTSGHAMASGDSATKVKIEVTSSPDLKVKVTSDSAAVAIQHHNNAASRADPGY